MSSRRRRSVVLQQWGRRKRSLTESSVYRDSLRSAPAPALASAPTASCPTIAAENQVSMQLRAPQICILNICVDVPIAGAQCPQDDAGHVCSSNGVGI